MSALMAFLSDSSLPLASAFGEKQTSRHVRSQHKAVINERSRWAHFVEYQSWIFPWQPVIQAELPLPYDPLNSRVRSPVSFM